MKADRELFFAVRKILLSDWDPICIGDNENLWDEYDRYVAAILGIYQKGQLSMDSLMKYLEEVEEKIICIPTNQEVRTHVAKKILASLPK